MAQENFGLLEQPFDPRDYWLDEVLGSDEVRQFPESHRITGLSYDPQFSYPYCVSFATTTMIEYAMREKKGGVVKYSQPHLFYHAGGSEVGSTFRGNLNVAKDKGVIDYDKYPMPDPRYSRPDDWHAIGKAKAFSIPFDNSDTISGYVRILSNNQEEMKRAILDHGPVLVEVLAAKAYFTDPWHKTTDVRKNHAVLCVGWTKDGRWILFDSLSYVSAPKDWGGEMLPAGYRTVSPDYSFGAAYVLTELPKNVKTVVEKARTLPPGNAERYGLSRDYPKELEVASQMLVEFKKFNNQSVLEAAGRFWELYIRAIVYGGYSLSYTKWGRWYAGDIINDCYHWRRTGQHIFNFNKKKGEDGYRLIS